jgi:two-component system response regulator
MNTPSFGLVLVEDNPDDVALTLRAIASTGVRCDVTVATHGGEAVELLSEIATPPDLIILDFHLPGRNGLEILRKVRSWDHTRDVPVVLLSALESDRDIVFCLREGANSCITKPTNAQKFSEFVSKLVEYWLTVNRRTGQMPPMRPIAESAGTKYFRPSEPAVAGYEPEKSPLTFSRRC